MQESGYALVARIPVAVLGLCGTLLVFLTALSASELGPIDAVCDWCLANDVVAVLLLPAALVRLR